MSPVYFTYLFYIALCMSTVLPPYPIWTQPPITPVIDVGISLLSQSVEITIEDRYAFIEYSFYFVNQNNDAFAPSSSQLDYEISLQPNTFISYFSAELNGVLFTGQTKERLQAANEYNHAVELGLNSILVSQDHDANVFNVKINMEKGGDAKLSIVAETFMLRRFGYYELSLLTTNIYSSAMIHSEFTSTQIVINLFDESDITYTDVLTPTNALHNINQITPNEYKIEIALQKSLTMRQELILLRYKTEASTDINQLLYNEESRTFLHIFSYEHQTVEILPRRVVLVLDRSGSMGVTKWQSAVSATVGAIQHLKPGIDKMNIILFDHVSTYYSSSMVAVTEDVITDAISWVNRYSSRGSTNIHQAVVDAIDLIKYDTVLYNSEFSFVNQIILVTDGKPTSGITDAVQIQNALYDFNNQQLQSAPASIFCLGIGDDFGDGWVQNLNYPLLRSIATQNEGFDAMIRASQTETILAQYYNILESPMLSYITLDYHSYTTNVESPNQNDIHNLTKTKYRGLYAGTDIVVAGKLTDNFNQKTGIIMSLFARSVDGNIVSNTYPMEFTHNLLGYNNIIIDRIWAYLRLKMYISLLDNPRLSSMNAMLYNLLQTNALNLALKYKLVTQWTSMIVVDQNNNEHQQTSQPQPSGSTHVYTQSQTYLAPPAVYTPGAGIGGFGAGAPQVIAPSVPKPAAVVSDCSSYSNDPSTCAQQTLSNGNPKCEYEQVNGVCSLIVQSYARAVASDSVPQNELFELLVSNDKDSEETMSADKIVRFISMGAILSILVCLLSALVFVISCHYCNYKKKNKHMEMLKGIDSL